MPDNSAIEWTEATWNPVTGCDKVSPGCAHCYAETFAERWRGIPGHPYEQGFALKLWPQRLEQPLKWSRPRMIFVNSMSDLFHEDIPDAYIEQVFEVMGGHGNVSDLTSVTGLEPDRYGGAGSRTVASSSADESGHRHRRCDPSLGPRPWTGSLCG